MGESWKITAKIFLREFEVGDIEQKIKYLFWKSWGEGGGGSEKNIANIILTGDTSIQV